VVGDSVATSAAVLLQFSRDTKATWDNSSGDYRTFWADSASDSRDDTAAGHPLCDAAGTHTFQARVLGLQSGIRAGVRHYRMEPTGSNARAFGTIHNQTGAITNVRLGVAANYSGTGTLTVLKVRHASRTVQTPIDFSVANSPQELAVTADRYFINLDAINQSGNGTSAWVDMEVNNVREQDHAYATWSYDIRPQGKNVGVIEYLRPFTGATDGYAFLEATTGNSLYFSGNETDVSRGVVVGMGSVAGQRVYHAAGQSEVPGPLTGLYFSGSQAFDTGTVNAVTYGFESVTHASEYLTNATEKIWAIGGADEIELMIAIGATPTSGTWTIEVSTDGGSTYVSTGYNVGQAGVGTNLRDTAAANFYWTQTESSNLYWFGAVRGLRADVLTHFEGHLQHQNVNTQTVFGVVGVTAAITHVKLSRGGESFSGAFEARLISYNN